MNNGLNRLIQHPQWLSHGCPVPCQSLYDYTEWNDVRDTNIQWEEQQQQQTSNNNIEQQQKQEHQITCHNDNDRQATVFVIGLDDVARHFGQMWNEQMSIRPAYDNAHQWAIQLGAKGYEAHQFALLENGDDIWYYATALLVRSGIVRFQPSFAKDIKSRIKSTTLPLNWPYTAISTYRGNETKKRPHELLTYFQQLERVGCKSSNNDKVRNNAVYVATDDPHWVQDEIDMFLRGPASNC